MGKTALSIGADTFAFFTRNPRGGKAKEFDKNDCDALIALMDENNFAPLVAHAPYTLNLCSADEKIRSFARATLKEDIEIVSHIPNALYNFHPGSHVGQGADEGIRLIAEALNECMYDGQSAVVLLETMAGKGSEVGCSFEEIKRIIDSVNMKEKIGVCLDTCHVNDAGYDIAENVDAVMEEFDRVIGLDKLCAIHINDSMNPKSSHKDRHAKIGEGTIGLEAFEKIVNCKYIKKLPFILETPNELDGYKKEIEILRKLYKED